MKTADLKIGMPTIAPTAVAPTVADKKTPAKKTAKPKTASKKPKVASGSGHGRPERYTKDLIMSLVGFAKKSKLGIKKALPLFEKSKLTDTQRKKKFTQTMKYVPLLVAAARHGISLRKLMKKTQD